MTDPDKKLLMQLTREDHLELQVCDERALRTQAEAETAALRFLHESGYQRALDDVRAARVALTARFSEEYGLLDGDSVDGPSGAIKRKEPVLKAVP